MVIEFAYEFDDKWEVELEIEYEHGGTGVTLEYDGFDEFGEFETEIEAGGEVIVEKLEVKYQYNDNISVKMGHITVPVGIGTDLHKPSQYFTTERHWSEATLIPQVWHETGVNISASWNNFTAQTLITTGLNSEYFRTHHWVATGHQTRFEQVNSDFGELFPKVFGGGSAYLELTSDDLLESGVSIMARPPGKKNSTIHLLSGGEKALTALSLVFSIFRLNPAPFCMLDEVDAPLDDANVGRFCRLVEEMSQSVQFIYISHNKIAMEMAGRLTGVTMAEPGVSRMVAVDIEQAVQMAHA